MADVRVQARFVLTPGDGSNEAVNTFHFYDAIRGYAAHADDALDAVEEFYTANAPTLFSSVGAQMAGTVLRAAELRAYDMAAALPRVPEIRPITLPAPLQATSLMPLEVACCVSYLAAPPVNGRKRGRIFLPGVHEGWFFAGSSTVIPLFQTGLGTETDVVRRAANRLVAHTADWVVRSTAGGAVNHYRIANGYVDTEPDTMRSRGIKSGAPRTPFV